MLSVRLWYGVPYASAATHRRRWRVEQPEDQHLVPFFARLDQFPKVELQAVQLCGEMG